MKQYRHGDLLLIEERIPTTAKITSRRVILEGEATGHAHRIDTNGVILLEENGQLWLRVKRGSQAALTHEEHATINVPPGSYRVMRQREYTPEAIVNVRD
jgi:hypothetical protein